MILLTSAFAITSIAGALALPQEPQEPQVRAVRSSDERVKETAEDVETLRVLLTKGLAASIETSQNLAHYRIAKRDSDDKDEDAKDSDDGKKRTAQADADGFFYIDPLVAGAYSAATGQNSTSFTRGFYAPGLGAWIDTTVTIRTVAKRVTKKDDSKEVSKDEWDQARAELRGEAKASEKLWLRLQMSRDLTASIAQHVLDEEQIEDAENAAVDVLAKYGHRLRHIPDDESVVIALKLDPGGSNDLTKLYGDLAAGRYQVDMFSGVQRSVDFLPSQTLIVRASKRLLDQYASGDVDKDAFRKRLSITRY